LPPAWRSSLRSRSIRTPSRGAARLRPQRSQCGPRCRRPKRHPMPSHHQAGGPRTRRPGLREQFRFRAPEGLGCRACPRPVRAVWGSTSERSRSGRNVRLPVRDSSRPVVRCPPSPSRGRSLLRIPVAAGAWGLELCGRILGALRSTKRSRCGPDQHLARQSRPASRRS
jgi:hypothetical protein